ncbi:MAG: peroxiredoxin [Xanthomonadaceae bacterium]|nr:peroxiredoxin [Xanthomonadaceae bacterium]
MVQDATVQDAMGQNAMAQHHEPLLGQTVADLPLTLSSGAAKSLSDFRGRWLVLYFYPKDSTPGCTTEAVAFDAMLPKFRQLGAVVLGVSRDSLKSHGNFVAKQGLQFDLASDLDQSLCQAFDVIKEKNLYGRKSLGIERSTFLLDPAGVVRRVWRRVKVPGHAQDVFSALQAARAQ